MNPMFSHSTLTLHECVALCRFPGFASRSSIHVLGRIRSGSKHRRDRNANWCLHSTHKVLLAKLHRGWRMLLTQMPPQGRLCMSSLSLTSVEVLRVIVELASHLIIHDLLSSRLQDSFLSRFNSTASAHVEPRQRKRTWAETVDPLILRSLTESEIKRQGESSCSVSYLIDFREEGALTDTGASFVN